MCIKFNDFEMLEFFENEPVFVGEEGDGEFISLYPGAQSGRVIDAIANGGTVWP